jgi:hypothetical protein
MKKIILVLGALCITYFLNAQSTIASSGANASGGGGTSSYTIGQLFYTANNQNNSSIAPGVQQAFEFQVLSNSDFLLENLILLTYPNPTSDNIIVSKSNDSSNGNLEYSLFDLQGKHIVSGLITEENTQIKLQYLTNGIYFLKVTRKNLSIKTIKIIKK